MYMILGLFSAFYFYRQPVILLVWLVWVQSALTVPSVRSQRKHCKLSSCLGQTSPLVNVCPSVEPSFTWRTQGCVKVSSHDLRKCRVASGPNLLRHPGYEVEPQPGRPLFSHKSDGAEDLHAQEWPPDILLPIVNNRWSERASSYYHTVPKVILSEVPDFWTLRNSFID